ncbi:DNA-directed RNA polymerase subunit K [Candidatus Pacearchaeota archaeon]|nr:DNA-directed RNA polymerase subunit K [Candidatus Pacearchaeota archaeon]
MDLTKYEKARIVGARALQLAMGAPAFIKLSKEELEKITYSTVEIAKMELAKNLIPITVRRPLPEKVETDVIPSEELTEEEAELVGLQETSEEEDFGSEEE